MKENATTFQAPTNHTVSCPNCGEQLYVYEQDVAYKCPKCNTYFQAEKKACQPEAQAEESPVKEETQKKEKTPRLKKTPKIKKRVDKSELIFYCCIIALPLLQILIFYFYVNFNSIMMAFKSYNSITDKFTWDWGVNNFPKFIKDLKSMILLDSLWNSLIVWLCTSVLGTFLCVLFAYYIYKKWFLAKTFKFFLFLPSVLPSILLVIVFKFFADEAIPGYMAELFGKTINPLLKRGSDTLFPTVLVYNLWVCFGAQLLIYTGAMDQIAPEIMEAGKVDGVSSVREFFSIVIPIILPTIATFVVANIATLFTNQANLYAFFGDKVDFKNYTIGYYLFELVNGEGKFKTEYTYASLLGIICTLVAFPLTMLARKALNREDE